MSDDDLAAIFRFQRRGQPLSWWALGAVLAGVGFALCSMILFAGWVMLCE